ncbi:response regulator transcription factor [Shouchella clausii]|uniref:response regulator transcription factor n=1 Tax=Shouchella clausii TaxID=79880 RepID=UPI00270E7789|nr:helix-turn-helix domain-containing protein [Shouchella clausii]MDO7269682.1 response regulator [Shouchella clausii]MDO7289692.1 response regulator [Shouchella clausii]
MDDTGKSFELLLVDDEEATVLGLSALPWETLGINRVHCACSASEALASLEKGNVDVVVTDIRMPGKSGIDLLVEVEKSPHAPKCLLLSGYAEFAYAQAAIQAQAVDYLLKPVSDEELMQAVGRALSIRKSELEKLQLQKRSMEAIRNNIGDYFEQVIAPWLSSKKSTFETKQELKSYGLPTDTNIKALWLFVHIHKEPSTDDVDGMKSVLASNLTKITATATFNLYKNLYAILLYPLRTQGDESLLNAVKPQILLLKTQLRKQCQAPITLTTSLPFLFWEEGPKIYQSFLSGTSPLVQEVRHKKEQLAVRVYEYVEAHFFEQPSLQEVADHLFLNAAYLSKRFKEETGEKFSDYIHRLRMDRAVEFLAETNMKVSQIAKKLGYKDASYFIKVFKREFHMTPQEFRSR